MNCINVVLCPKLMWKIIIIMINFTCSIYIQIERTFAQTQEHLSKHCSTLLTDTGCVWMGVFKICETNKPQEVVSAED